ncbi:MAG: amidohydrolase family protein [Ancalomicrobiaceae bacterium]|nr:amidohydrolase family protein [Ancalomicrobiaceae bacterium]
MSGRQVISGIDPATGKGLAVTMEDGLIAAIRPEHDADSVYLSAGLIDLQVNGFGGLDFNSGELTTDTVFIVAQKLAALGVTTFLPTLVTAAEDRIIERLKIIAAARRAHPLVNHMVPAVHVEGPAISRLDGPRGAHALAYVRAPLIEEFERWQQACGELVGLVTLAPEYPEAPAYIESLTARGVHVALGHTAATPDAIHRAVDAGAVLSTHLGNGAAALLPRHPNFIWTQLADDRLTASFIADGHHLPADTFKAMLRAKGLARAVLVSDSVALAGMGPGRYEQAIGGAVEVSTDGRIAVAGTPYLAGAGLPLIANVAIAITMADLSLAEALGLATVNPGRFVNGRGRLQLGERADILRFSWAAGARTLAVEDVWIAGERIAAP